MERIIEIVDHGGPEGWHSYSFGEAREHIVRCVDCKFAGAGEAVISGEWRLGNCGNPRFKGSRHVVNVTHAGFCAWAERRDARS